MILVLENQISVFFKKKKNLGLTQARKLKTEKMFQIHLKLPVFLQVRLVNLYLRYFLGKGQQVKPAKTANFTFFQFWGLGQD